MKVNWRCQRCSFINAPSDIAPLTCSNCGMPAAKMNPPPPTWTPARDEEDYGIGDAAADLAGAVFDSVVDSLTSSTTDTPATYDGGGGDFSGGGASGDF